MALAPVYRRPLIGVSAILLDKDNRILLAERLSSKLKGYYGAPGGHLEWMQSFRVCAVTELEEETGVKALISNCDVIGVDQGFAPEEDHCWVIVYVSVKKWDGVPMTIEPDRHGKWKWYPLREIPKNTIPTLKALCYRLADELER